MFEPKTLAILIPALPLLAAIVTALLGPKVLRSRSHWPAVLGVIGSFLCSMALAMHLRDAIQTPTNQVGYEEIVTLWTWAEVPDAISTDRVAGPTFNPAPTRDLSINVALRTDALTVMMLCMVTFVSSLVVVYSVGYMHADRGYWRFFAYVALFVFSMTMLVSVSNFMLLFVFWEAVGVCSYLLIGFWYQKESAAAAGQKAFLVNRVGDFGFMLAMFLIWITYGSWNFHDTAAAAGVLGQTRLASPEGYVGGGLGLAICLCLLMGACGKSAQLPLHVWLADAMEGPTPVSALIHAATMVTAGVYMIARCTPLFMASPTAQLVVACVGALTALVAGLIALTQFDLKRVLAYSTISQLGYMFLALGAGTLAGVTAGMFHLFTHAFFKALLFLGAGSVMHAMGNVIDMRRFGGLRRRMPITCWTFLAGCVALAGLWPFSGFWSKDTILGAVHDQALAVQSELAKRPDATITGGVDDDAQAAVSSTEEHVHHEVSSAHLGHVSTDFLQRANIVYPVLYYMGLFTAFLTSIYTFRAFYLTFCGDEVIPDEAGDHAHEAPSSMWVPLSILAAFALVVGLLLHQTHLFENLLAYTPSLATDAVRMTPQPGVFHQQIAIISSVVAFAGLAIASFLYLGSQREAGWIASALSKTWLGAPYLLARGKFYFDEIYDVTIVKPLRALATFSYGWDRWVIDGLVNLFGWLPRAAGAALRGLQMGLIPFYGLAMVLGALTLLAARMIWGGNG